MAFFVEGGKGVEFNISSVSMDLKDQKEGADGNGPDGGLPHSAS